jgi:hypothetical protein
MDTLQSGLANLARVQDKIANVSASGITVVSLNPTRM